MFQLPQLNYAYDALEPFIDTLTMETHHSKHHQAYINNLNTALEKHPELSEKSIEDLLIHFTNLPSDIQNAVRNNGGGHFNHSLFWTMMSPEGQKEPTGVLKSRIEVTFDTFDNFKSLFKAAALARFGSGWAWLVVNKNGVLEIMSTANQDSPISEGKKPILGLDVWEHAYYLNYTNRRGDYIDQWWHVVDWSRVSELFHE
ncbi:MAG: superoxide dismutase [Vallitaleaceae bacterium]|nr:superoxide dismutase [Vallitaleaceae bacterium]